MARLASKRPILLAASAFGLGLLTAGTAAGNAPSRLPSDKEVAEETVKAAIGDRILCACRSTDLKYTGRIGILRAYNDGKVAFGPKVDCVLRKYNGDGSKVTSGASYCHDYEIVGKLKKNTSL